MAHLEKYNRRQLPHILKHDERARDKNGNYINFANQSIDTSRTHLNYNLHERNDGLSDYEFIMKQGKKHLAKNVVNRDNVNWVGSWVITLPEKLADSAQTTQRRFFEEATAFLEKRYGYENIVGAYVHNDETTPHMHVKVLPIFYDEKKKKMRMSAKDVFDKAELGIFHADLEKHMNNVFGYDIGIRKTWINKDEKASKRTIEELKQETATMTKEAEQMAADNELLNKMNKSLEKEVLASKRELDTVKEDLKDSQKMNELLKEEMEGRDFLGRKKAVADEISSKMEAEIERRTKRKYEQNSDELKQKSYRLKQKEKELSERERAVNEATRNYNNNFDMSDRIEKLEQRNMQLERMLHVFARSVFKLSKKIYKEALSALAEVGQRELLKIANIVRDEPGRNKEQSR